MTAHRPLAYAIDASEPEPWSVAAPAPDTEPDRPGRYSWIAPARLDTGHDHPSAARAAAGRTCRATDPCVVPPPGSDRMGAGVVEGRVVILPAPRAPVRSSGDKQ